jgi:hypothetical protein
MQLMFIISVVSRLSARLSHSANDESSSVYKGSSIRGLS